MAGLVRRYLALQGYTGLRVGKPIAAKDRGRLLKDGHLEKFVKYAATEPGAIAVLVLFDADKDAACQVGPSALRRVQDSFEMPVKICIAVRNVENWIVASAESTLDRPPLDDPEGTGAVHAVKTAMKPRAYKKTVHQPGLTERIDFDVARSRSPSFDRFLRIIDEIAQAS